MNDGCAPCFEMNIACRLGIPVRNQAVIIEKLELSYFDSFTYYSSVPGSELLEMIGMCFKMDVWRF